MSVSKLFSTSDKPYLDYRLAENVFCKYFDAENLSRSCIAIDAKKGTVGIGIKTFVDNTSYQKIAEFDQKIDELNGDAEHDAVVVSELRNMRLDFSRDAYGITDFIYHFILRRSGSFAIYEESMPYIDTSKVKVTHISSSSFDFTDGIADYRFNRSKSTLFKSFDLSNPIYSEDVEMFDDALERFVSKVTEWNVDSGSFKEYIILPLFSMRGSRHVPEKSGLNQWNAGGRKRDPNEVYIPYSKKSREEKPGFFPERYTPFRLFLPDGTELSASVCQDDGKAIMSNPNKDLGEWLLRTVLHLGIGELATIQKLDNLGIDSVIITKENDGYKIDFTYVGEEFIE